MDVGIERFADIKEELMKRDAALRTLLTQQKDSWGELLVRVYSGNKTTIYEEIRRAERIGIRVVGPIIEEASTIQIMMKSLLAEISKKAEMLPSSSTGVAARLSDSIIEAAASSIIEAAAMLDVIWSNRVNCFVEPVVAHLRNQMSVGKEILDRVSDEEESAIAFRVTCEQMADALDLLQKMKKVIDARVKEWLDAFKDPNGLN